MQTRFVDGVTIRPLRNGDVAGVAAVFARLGDESRRRRFGGAKPRLTAAELVRLARVDATHHVLLAYLDGDPRPVGMAQLVRQGRAGEIACAVADEWQEHGIGSVLLGELTDLARAAGLTEVRAVFCCGNSRAVALGLRLARVREARRDGGDLEVVFGL